MTALRTSWTVPLAVIVLALAGGWVIQTVNAGPSSDLSAVERGGVEQETGVDQATRVEQEIRIVSGAIELAGTLTLPEGQGPFPTVIALSGAGPQSRTGLATDERDARQMPEIFTRHGLALLRTDDRGVGESTGDTGSATIEDLIADTLAMVETLDADPRVGTIGLLGASQGALVAAAAAA
ncbi:MAG: alpha/beta hydrolase, partial [Acidobacteriota bacterium]